MVGVSVGVGAVVLFRVEAGAEAMVEKVATIITEKRTKGIWHFCYCAEI